MAPDLFFVSDVVGEAETTSWLSVTVSAPGLGVAAKEPDGPGVWDVVGEGETL